MTTKRSVAKDMALQGVPVQAICASLNVSSKRYRGWRETDPGWPDRAVPPLPPEVREEALGAIDAGETVSAVSRRLGIARKTISRWRRLRPATRWRCYCTPFGVPVSGDTCPSCTSTREVHV